METSVDAEISSVDLLDCLKIKDGLVGHYPKKITLYQPGFKGERFYLVLEGVVLLSTCSSEGRVVGLEMLEPEEFFGFENFTPRNETIALSLGHTKVVSWDCSYVLSSMGQSPALATAFASALMKRSLYFEKRIQDLATLPVQGRLAAFLIYMSERPSASVNTDGTISIPRFTHEVMSQFVATSRECLTQRIIKMREDGIIEAKARRPIRIMDPKGLSELARASLRSK